MEPAYATAMLFFIVIGAFIFARFIVLTQFPNALARLGEGRGPVAVDVILLAVIAALLPARHLPRGGEHDPHHRSRSRCRS